MLKEKILNLLRDSDEELDVHEILDLLDDDEITKKQVNSELYKMKNILINQIFEEGSKKPYWIYNDDLNEKFELISNRVFNLLKNSEEDIRLDKKINKIKKGLNMEIKEVYRYIHYMIKTGDIEKVEHRPLTITSI